MVDKRLAGGTVSPMVGALASVVATVILLAVGIAVFLYLLPVKDEDPSNVIAHAIVIGVLAMLANRAGDFVAGRRAR